MTEMKSQFTKNDTNVIKGIGIILMLIHHLWSNSDRTPIPAEYQITGPFAGLTLNGPSWFHVLGSWGKICVPIFAFLAGYGLYKQHEAGKFSLPGKIKKLYLQYWKVFIIFIPIAFLFFKNQEIINLFSGNYRQFHINECIVNFFAVDTEKYNGEWWFVMGFTICCILGSIYVPLTSGWNRYKDFLLVFMINFILFGVTPLFIYNELFKNFRSGFIFNMFIKQKGITAFFTGIIWAKHGLSDQWKQIIMQKKPVLRVLLFLAGTLAYICLRNFNGFNYWDFAIIPFYITLLLGFVETIPFLRHLFGFLGLHSENMWLVHSFFCYYFTPFVKIIYGTQNALIALLLLLAFSLAASLLLNKFYQACGFLCRKLKI